jgi:ribosome recycling factor
MVTEALESAERRMGQSIESLKKELATIRTGRASSVFLENVMVDYYGAITPLNQLATVMVPQGDLIVVQPWDRQALSMVEKALLKANLGLTPTNDGTVIRLSIPQLTEDRRRDLVKQVKRYLEEGRVAVRNVRRDVMEKLRAMERDKELSKDEGQRAQNNLQKYTDFFIGEMETIVAIKETDLMAV